MIKNYIRKSAIGVSLLLTASNQIAKYKLSTDIVGNKSGMRHAELPVEESVRYIKTVYKNYLTRAGIERFHGKVAEIGPGDNFGVALLMLGGGANAVDLLDRFVTHRDPEQQAKIYKLLIDTSPELSRFSGLSREEEFPGLAWHYGEGAAAENFFVEHRGYDFIVSQVVLEHVMDPLLSLRRMIEALNPGGIMVHAVDLSDHGMFSVHGHPALTFLEPSDWVYRNMTDATGRPNRVRLASYREAFPDAEFKIAALVGVGELKRHLSWDEIPEDIRTRSLEVVRAAQPRMHPRYRGQALEDLAVSTFFMTYKKPIDPAPPRG